MSANPKFAVVPVELQAKILSFLSTSKEQDLWFLWTTVRNVSTGFRSMVEDLVRKKQLKYTSIQYELDWIYLEEGGKLDMSTEFVFDRIAPENPNIAVFKAEVADEYKEDIKSALRCAGVEGQKFYEPPHTVFIRRAANDTELPNYSIDFETFELSCDWKGLFTAFCYEEKLKDTFSQHFAVECVAGGLPSGADATPELMMNFLLAYGKSHDNNRKKARRSRIARQCAREGLKFDEEWLEYEEEKILERLKSAACAGNYATFSDDEEEDDEEEKEPASNQEEEGDEWEDDDEEEYDEDEDEMQSDGENATQSNCVVI